MKDAEKRVMKESLGLDPDEDSEKEFFIDNLLVRSHFIIVMIRWTGLAPWEIEYPFPGATFLRRT